jgi:hypothetical protein
VINKIDLANRTLVSTISAACSGISYLRSIGFDPTLDDGKGGFWVGDMMNIGAISMTGSSLISGISLGSNFPMGIAFYPYTDPQNPCLWIMTAKSSGVAIISQFDIATRALTGVVHNCAAENPYHDEEYGEFIAGRGLAAYNNGAGKFLLAANLNREPNLILVYELCNVAIPPAISTTSLPNGIVGEAYNKTLAATGTTPITWSLESGTLPNGLALSGGGVISGTPTTEGTFNFTVKATNEAGSATKELSITTKEMWNLAFWFEAKSGGNFAIGTDGKNFYTAHNFALTGGGGNFTQYEMDGSNPQTFTIDGVDKGVFNMTYDGTYFYTVNQSNQTNVINKISIESAILGIKKFIFISY